MRPASLRQPNPFIKPKKKAGSKKLGLDIDKIDLSYNHKARDEENKNALTNLRLLLVQAEQSGRWSKAKKIRRQINQYLEEGLYLTHSWCYGCNNVLHNCQCEVN